MAARALGHGATWVVEEKGSSRRVTATAWLKMAWGRLAKDLIIAWGWIMRAG
jgi:hypothetical protein